LSTILTGIVTIVGCGLGGRRFFAYYPGMLWSKFTCIISLCPVKIRGKEKLNRSQSYIFVSNHQGAYDIFLLYGYLGQPIKWVMKESLRFIPLVGEACHSAGFIFVDNSSPKAAAQTIEIAKEQMQEGDSFVFFPEGSRSKTGQLGVFKKGAYHMAMDMKLPIVPITINGTFEVMPNLGYWIRPHRIELIIHDPIDTSEFPRGNLRETVESIRSLIDITKETIHGSLWEKYL